MLENTLQVKFLERSVADRDVFLFNLTFHNQIIEINDKFYNIKPKDRFFLAKGDKYIYNKNCVIKLD